jgi:DNA-binding beta-propeller fold protein YncE
MWVVDSAGGVSSVPAASGLFALALSPDGETLYGSISVGDSAGHVLLIDRASRTVTATLDVAGTPRRTGFDPLGQVALIGNEGGYVSIVR